MKVLKNMYVENYKVFDSNSSLNNGFTNPQKPFQLAIHYIN